MRRFSYTCIHQMNRYFKPESGNLLLSGGVYRRITLFDERWACEIFLRTLETYRQLYEVRIFAYVLMPDHFHLVFSFPAHRKLQDFLRDFKSFVGRQIIDAMKTSNSVALLLRFEMNRSKLRTRDATYCVLQRGSHLKPLRGEKALWKALNYVHSNPVRAGLALSPEEYPFSSAFDFASRTRGIVQLARIT
jgi:putative transposase